MGVASCRHWPAAQVLLLLGLASSQVISAQTNPPVNPNPAPPNPQTATESQINNASPGSCLEPEPLMQVEDYTGPFRKTALYISRKFERRAVHKPHYKPGAILCSLSSGEKFKLFVLDSVEPLTFVAAGFNAGLAQAQDDDSKFGQGAQGYGKRFGAAYTDQASENFFKNFLYPSLFREDPRYYRVAHGPGGRRLLYALRHSVVAHHDSGKLMFNFSEWLGTASAVSLSNLYHPGNQRGFGPTAKSIGINMGIDTGFDVLREFLPEILRKLHLPVARHEAAAATQSPLNRSR